MIVADKHVFAKAFSKNAPIEVPAPELGEGVVVRFKPDFTVDELAQVVLVQRSDAVEGGVNSPAWTNPLLLEMLLVRIAMVDEHGNKVVQDNAPEWFQQGSSGVLMCRLARRAGLVEQFLKCWKAAPDSDSQEVLDAEKLNRLIADLATVMKISPTAIRSWPASDLADVLAAFKEQADARSGD